MDMLFSYESIDKIKTGAVVIGIFEKELTKEARFLDKKLDNAIAKSIKNKEFGASYKDFLMINTFGKIKPEKVLLVGFGKKKDLDAEKLRRLSGIAAKLLRDSGVKDYSTTLHWHGSPQAVVEGTILGLYQFIRKTTDLDKIRKIKSFTLLCHQKYKKVCEKEAAKGKILAEATNYAKDITNTPAAEMTPSGLASEAKKLGLSVKVYGKNEMKKMGMNSILAVSQGSAQEPKLIILEYNKGKKDTIVIAGKGVTFDSGGLDLKPAAFMTDMKSDKGGAAAVLGVMKTLPKLKPSVHVVGIIPAVENMPSGTAIRPGDIITAYNKKTIELINTDAEGRLILADTLSYAEKTYKPKAIIDLATLTGASIIALGYFAAPILGEDKLVAKMREAGKKTGDYIWKLPLWDDYKELMKGDITDVINSSKGSRYGPGVITGAVFLSNFVEKVPWIHIDIGATAWFNEDKEYRQKGATGFGVRLVTQFLEDW